MLRKIKCLFLVSTILLTGCGSSELTSKNSDVSQIEHISESNTVEASIENSETDLSYMDFNDLDKGIIISNDIIDGYLVRKGKGFNRSLDDDYNILVGELTNISDAAVEISLNYVLYDDEYCIIETGGYNHPYLKPGEKALVELNFLDCTDAEYFSVESDLFEASESYAKIYDSMKIEISETYDETKAYTISTDGTDYIEGVLTIFYYDANDNIVATDYSMFGGSVPVDGEFDSPNCDYSKYLVSYTEY